MSQLEFPGVYVEDVGLLAMGTLKLNEKSLSFKSEKGGKSVNINGDDIDGLKWQKLGNKPGLRVGVSDGAVHRFGGFKDTVSSRELQEICYFFNEKKINFDKSEYKELIFSISSSAK